MLLADMFLISFINISLFHCPNMVLGLVISISILALIFAALLTKQILSKDSGTEAMQDVSNAIKTGAEAFFKRQYTTIAVLAIVLSVLIYIAYAFFGKTDIGWRTSVS